MDPAASETRLASFSNVARTGAEALAEVAEHEHVWLVFVLGLSRPHRSLVFAARPSVPGYLVRHPARGYRG